MHCLKGLGRANQGLLQRVKNAAVSTKSGANMILARTQKPAPLPCWAAASAHTHRGSHHQTGPDVDQGYSK